MKRLKTTRKTVYLPKSIVDKFNRLLSMADVDFDAENIDVDATLFVQTVVFRHGVEADIKVCSGETNLFVDPVLFKNGSECNSLETENTLDGEYLFHNNDREYVVKLVPV